MDFIGRMIDEPNATKRLAFLLFVFIPGFWMSIAAVVFVPYYALYFIGWLISLVVG